MRQYEVPIASGPTPIADSSTHMDRVLSVAWKNGVAPTAGTFSIEARPWGRTQFIPIEGASALAATTEHSIIFAYPYQELRLVGAGIVGSAVAIISVQDGEG